MTILAKQAPCARYPVNRELGVEMNNALSDAKRLRRHICRLLTAARVAQAEKMDGGRRTHLAAGG